MARITLLELHLDESQFTANAPFSGEKSPESIGKSIGERVGSGRESGGRNSSSRALSVLIGAVAVVGFVAVARRALSGDEESVDEAVAEEPIVAD